MKEMSYRIETPRTTLQKRIEYKTDMMRATWAKSCCRVTFAESSSTHQRRPFGIAPFPRRSTAGIFRISSTVSFARPPISRYYFPTCPKPFPPYWECSREFRYRNYRRQRSARVQSENKTD